MYIVVNSRVAGGSMIGLEYLLSEVKPEICFSHFFELCGIMVKSSKIEEDNTLNPIVSEIFQKLLKIEKDGGEHHPEFIEINPYKKDGQEGQLTDDSEICKNTVMQALKKLKDAGMLGDAEHAALELVAKVYGDFNLRLHEYNSKYYWYDPDVARQTYYAFAAAEKRLFWLLKVNYGKLDTEGYMIIRYARCYCARRAMEMEKAMEKVSRYSARLVFEDLKEITEKLPEFITVYLLMGHVAEINGNDREQGIRYYRMFIEKCREKQFCSEAYYRLGKIYEAKHRKEKAQECFKQSLECNPNNYRSMYKIGEYLELNCGKFFAARKMYEKIEEMLKILKEQKEMQPIELEYLFKIYFRCGRLYLKRIPNPKKAYRYFKEEEKLEAMKVSDIPFMQTFYGEEAEKYLSYTKSRFPMYQIRINQQSALTMEYEKSEKLGYEA